MLVAIPAILIVTLLLLIGAGVGYYSFVPAFAAQTVIHEVNARVKLEFYYVIDEGKGSGRYLTIDTTKGSTTIPLTAFDWAHNARTSIYLTTTGMIGIVEPTSGRDILFSPETHSVTEAHNMESQSWTYIGAFDYNGATYNREFRFYSREQQPECIPTLGQPASDYQVRKNARQPRCGF